MNKSFTWFKENKWHLIGLLICYLIFQLMFFFIKGSERYFSFFFLFLDIVILFFIIPDSKNFRFLKYIIIAILFIPFSIVYLVGLIFPILEVLLICAIAIVYTSFLTYYLFTYLPNLIIGQELSFPTIIYLSITLSIVLLYLFGEQLVRLIWSLTYLHKLFKKEFKSQLEMKKLLLRDIAKIERMRFLLYTAFFVFLIIYSLQNINETIWLFPQAIYQSIFYSFVTFLAFDRIVVNSNLMKINFNQLIYTLLKFSNPGIEEEEKYYRLKKKERIQNK